MKEGNRERQCEPVGTKAGEEKWRVEQSRVGKPIARKRGGAEKDNVSPSELGKVERKGK